MFEMIVNWYKQYPSVWIFLFHKTIHVLVGLLITLFTAHFAHMPTLGIVMVLAVGIIKEISDNIRSYDEQSQSYQYDAPLSAHILDVIVTVLGGILGLLINYFV